MTNIDKTIARHTTSKLTNNRNNSLMLANNENLASYLSTDIGSWESEKLTSLIQQVPWTDDVQSSDQQDGTPSFTTPHNADTATSISCDENFHLVYDPVDMNVDERVGSIMRYLETMGFETFDDLVRTYYGQHFGEESFLCHEQRLSRNRRLPGVIASLICAATNWTPWERRGFQEEIQKATEAMLISESAEAHIDLQNRVACILETYKSLPNSVKPIVSPLKNSITSKVSLLG